MWLSFLQCRQDVYARTFGWRIGTSAIRNKGENVALKRYQLKNVYAWKKCRVVDRCMRWRKTGESCAVYLDRRIVCCLSRPDRAPRRILWSRGGVYNVFLVAEDLIPHQSLLNTKQQRLMWTDWIPTHSSQTPSQEVRILVFLFVKPSREVWQTCYLVLFAVSMALWI